MNKTIFTLILCIISILTAKADNVDSINYPVIGKPCPDFTLNDVKYYHKSTLTNADLKGKWFLLDFWGEYCAGCIASFPKMNEIQKEFGNDFQIIMIGVPHKNAVVTIENVYEKHRIDANLILPIVYDSRLADQFHAIAFPHQVIVDPQGIVRYITSGISKENVRQLLNGEEIVLPRVYNTIEPKPSDGFDRKVPLLVNGNGGSDNDYYLRSLLTRGSKLMPLLHVNISDDRVQLINVSLDQLYKYAIAGQPAITWPFPHDSLYGKIWPELIKEVKDTSFFNLDNVNYENNFAYNSFVSDRYRKEIDTGYVNLPDLLRKELELTLPYTCSIEKRFMPCYELVISEAGLKKLKSKHKEFEFNWLNGQHTGFEAKAMEIIALRAQIGSSPGFPLGVPIFYSGPEILIDLKLISVYYEDRKKELKKYGIELKNINREIDVIVIRDK